MNIVFVYGTLKRGQSNHSLLDGSEFIATGITRDPYAMYSTGGYPVVFRDEQYGWIAGEVYYVNDAILAILDRLEGHPNFFCRHKVVVETLDGSFHDDAWMYFGDGFGDRSRLPMVPLSCDQFVWTRNA